MTDDVAAWGTLAAAVLALLAIVQSSRQARRAERALLRERRIDFMLDLLVEATDLNASDSLSARRDVRYRAIARMLPVDLVPMLRAGYDLRDDG